MIFGLGDFGNPKIEFCTKSGLCESDAKARTKKE